MKNSFDFSNMKIEDIAVRNEFEVRAVERIPKFEERKRTGEFEENVANVILRSLANGNDFQVKVKKGFSLVKEEYDPSNGRKKVKLKNTTFYPYNLFKGVIRYSISAEDLEEIMLEGDFLDEEI